MPERGETRVETELPLTVSAQLLADDPELRLVVDPCGIVCAAGGGRLVAVDAACGVLAPLQGAVVGLPRPPPARPPAP